MTHRLLRLAILVMAIGCMGHAMATGYYGPSEYLSNGESNIVGTPEFYWELETKRLARDFHPTEKPMVVVHGLGDDGLVDQGPMLKATSDADLQEFADALKTGAIKSPDPATATQEHAAARNLIATPVGTALPPEFDSEFADYHRGAFAFRLGKDHWAEARQAWEGLLKRPAGERHYRSVWAAFMLGKLAMKNGDADAVKWFQLTRALAQQGFADSLGMAADSYGWEARSEWMQGHPEKAAPLFLTQLALGDESAVVSLKALIPDRDPVDGMLNYGPERTDTSTPPNATAAAALDAKSLDALKVAARDPLLRRLVTAHILATESTGSRWTGDSPTAQNLRSVRWLQVIDEAHLGAVEDAEYLGWLAYMSGDYKAAQRWLELTKGSSPAAEWLHAKLQLRAGHLEDAVKSLAQALDTLRDPSHYTGWTAGPFQDENGSGPRYVYSPDNDGWSMGNAASGDLGGLHLARGDFVQAMDVLLKGGLWEDAAFVAERILTTKELKAYVDKLPVPPPSATSPLPGNRTNENDLQEGKSGEIDTNDVAKLRYLLGRRLVRENRLAEAAVYLPNPYEKIVQKYAKALADGADEKLPKLERTRAFFTAAWLARYDGMELMGTEVAPDGFVFGGDFQSTDIAQERLSGQYTETRWVNGGEKNATLKTPLEPTREEIQRLKRNTITPDARWHYRFVAGDLAMRSAGLMKDNTEELADVVNTAGRWVKDLDDKTGDRYYQLIDRRCSRTRIGTAAAAKHWFVQESGPWSTQEAADYDALHMQYGDMKKSSDE